MDFGTFVHNKVHRVKSMNEGVPMGKNQVLIKGTMEEDDANENSNSNSNSNSNNQQHNNNLQPLIKPSTAVPDQTREKVVKKEKVLGLSTMIILVTFENSKNFFANTFSQLIT